MIKSEAAARIGIEFPIGRKKMTVEEFDEMRLGIYREDSNIMSLQEFNVRKITPRYE